MHMRIRHLALLTEHRSDARWRSRMRRPATICFCQITCTFDSRYQSLRSANVLILRAVCQHSVLADIRSDDYMLNPMNWLRWQVVTKAGHYRLSVLLFFSASGTLQSTALSTTGRIIAALFCDILYRTHCYYIASALWRLNTISHRSRSAVRAM
jgi:hypothetical protein